LTAVEALSATLDTQDADLIVAGAFGHSMIYEWLFGGVTGRPHVSAVPASTNVAFVGWNARLPKIVPEYVALQH
jgi:hypothetical protein